ncbi:hypothetical protein PG995_015226 [Apiospora arundinis]
MMAPHATESPAKKQSKWSAEEDALIIELRGNGMKWEDISKRLPGRSAISCRLHYQNYLERRSEWDDERKNKLARLYERFKPEMWAKVAEEMAIPWRAAEAMHWQLGEHDMARRAGVVPFALSAVNLDSAQAKDPRGVIATRTHKEVFHATWSAQREVTARPIVTRKESMPPHMPSHLEHGPNYDYAPPGGPLAPIQAQSQQRPGMLPGLAELTTGVSPYSTPAYSIGIPSVSPAQSATASPGPFIPAMAYPPLEPAGSKRRRSPDFTQGEANRRRHLDPQPLERVMPRHMP